MNWLRKTTSPMIRQRRGEQVVVEKKQWKVEATGRRTKGYRKEMREVASTKQNKNKTNERKKQGGRRR